MNTQKISFALFAIFALVLTLSAVSAFTSSVSSSKVEMGKTATISVSGVAGESVSVTPLTSNPAEFSLSGITSPMTFTAAGTQTLTLSAPSTVFSSTNIISLKDYAFTYTLANTTTSKNETVTFIRGFCKSGPVGGNLSINSVDISSTGDEDDEWKALDEVTVEVELENIGSSDIDDIFVEIGLFDSTGKNVINDVDFISSDDEKADIGRIRDGDEEIVTFEFKIPGDMDSGSYKLAIKAYSSETSATGQCVDNSDDLDQQFYEDVSVVREDDEGKFIAFDNIKVTPSESTCGESVTLTVDAYNIGDNDEDQVKITLYNKDLGINLAQEIKSGLDMGDSKQISFTFDVPANAQDKTYKIDLSAEYDYRNGVYRESLDEPTQVLLTLIGCTPVVEKIATISASMESDAAVAGNEVVITSRITNAKSTQAIFAVTASGYSSWAELVSITPQTLTLNSGESKDVTFTFKINDDASGSNSFNIDVASGTQTETKRATLDVTKASSFGSLDLSGSNWLIWVIGAINVILIILIIVVAVRVSRR